MAAPRRRLAVARFWYEGNAFCLLPAGWADFRRREWRCGSEALAAARGTATELAAVCDFAQAHPDWDVVVSRCAAALPAGAIDDEVFDTFMAEVMDDLQRLGPWDAIYLSLHGAGITARRDAPELDFVQRVRAAWPAAPLGASFDLHANQAPALAGLLTVASAYRTYPHVDMRETAARTLALLRRAALGEIRPVGALRNEGLYLSSANMRTAAGPMAELEAAARAQERGAVLDVSVFGGFAYANSRHIGASVMAWADGDATAAQAAVDAVYAALQESQAEFDVPLIAPAAGIALALQTPGLVAVTDAADNPMSGGIGDTPALLAALLQAPPSEATVFAALADPGVVAAAQQAGVGAALDVRLGGRLTPLFGPPVPLRATVERLTEGRFVNAGPMEHGATVECGPSVVLRHGAVQLIVTSHVAPCNDPAFFALHGIDLERTRLLCVKAKNHFRAAFAERCATIVDIDAPGPATLDLSRLPLRLPSPTSPAPPAPASPGRPPETPA